MFYACALSCWRASGWASIGALPSALPRFPPPSGRPGPGTPPTARVSAARHFAAAPAPEGRRGRSRPGAGGAAGPTEQRPRGPPARAAGLSRRHGEEAAPEGQDVSGREGGPGGAGGASGPPGVRGHAGCGEGVGVLRLPVSDSAVSAGTSRARSTRSSTGARKQVKG